LAEINFRVAQSDHSKCFTFKTRQMVNGKWQACDREAITAQKETETQGPDGIELVSGQSDDGRRR